MGSLELMSGSNQQQPDSVNPYANTEFAKASQGDLSNGRWGIDNWFRNLFSFGDYDKQRDAAYQLYLNNTSMQRAKADSEKAGINPLYTIGNLSSGAGSNASTNLFNHKKDGGKAVKNLVDSAFKIVMMLSML